MEAYVKNTECQNVASKEKQQSVKIKAVQQGD